VVLRGGRVPLYMQDPTVGPNLGPWRGVFTIEVPLKPVALGLKRTESGELFVNVTKIRIPGSRYMQLASLLARSRDRIHCTCRPMPRALWKS